MSDRSRPTWRRCRPPAELATLRDFVDRLGMLFEEDRSEASARRRHAELVSDRSFLAVPELARAIGALGPEKYARMIAFLKSPACHRVRTNNHVERVNRKLRYEEKARYRWRSRRTTVRFLVLLLDRYWGRERAIRNRWQEDRHRGSGTGHLRRQRRWIGLRDRPVTVGISEKCPK